MSSSICHPHAAPEFKQIVDKALALFAVYTGATLSFFVRDFLFSDNNLLMFHGLGAWLGYWGFWAALAVIALLLRYIVGSAVHLNFAYVPKTKQKIDPSTNQIESESTYRSTNVCHLFVDFLFLIAFGILALLLTRATANVESLMWHAIYFTAAGFTWSFLALFRSKERRIAATWIVFDGALMLWTWGIVSMPIGDLAQAVVLGISYLVFLFADLWCMVRLMSQGAHA